MCPKKLIRLLFICTILDISAQENYYHYFVYLKDKPNEGFTLNNPSQYLSSKAIERRKRFNISITEEDLPVSTAYISQIDAIENCEIWNKSKWLNAVEIRFKDESVIERIKTLPFVSSLKFLGKIKFGPYVQPPSVDSQYLKKQSDAIDKSKVFSESDYGDAYRQNSLINIPALHNMQYKGNGITIAVFDAGFANVYKTPGMSIDFTHLVKRDFVTHDNSVWEDDRHGANVLGFMKTNNPGTYIGTAPLANYILFRTEEAASEYPVEEVNWLAAAELADSMGADLISSSLGYNNFDDTSLSHHYRDLDGKTSIIAKAANIAHSKGIFIVVSAGNEGNNKWHKIGTPSDAPGVITIGATDAEGTHADFSSYGPSEDGRVKPDFVVMGKKAMVASASGVYTGNGTSYATPIFAGALACLIQACPGKSYDEILKALVLSSTHTNEPDSGYGYGIPDMALACALLGNYLGMDTTRDIFWNNPEGSYWQNEIMHFRSGSDQTIEIKITGKPRHKTKTISSKKITLKKGEWFHSDELHKLIAQQAMVRRKRKFSEINFNCTTSMASQNRSFKIP